MERCVCLFGMLRLIDPLFFFLFFCSFRFFPPIIQATQGGGRWRLPLERSSRRTVGMRLSEFHIFDENTPDSLDRAAVQNLNSPLEGLAPSACSAFSMSNMWALENSGSLDENSETPAAPSSRSLSFRVLSQGTVLSAGHSAVPSVSCAAALASSVAPVDDTIKLYVDDTTRKNGSDVPLLPEQDGRQMEPNASTRQNRKFSGSPTASDAYMKRLTTSSEGMPIKEGTYDSCVEIPITRPPIVIPKRQPPTRGSVKFTVAPDGRRSWVLFAPRRQNDQRLDSVCQETAPEWDEKVVAPPPDHLPRRVLDILASGRLSARGVGKTNEEVLNIDKPAALAGDHDSNKIPDVKRRSSLEGKEQRETQANKRDYTNDDNDDNDSAWSILCRWLLRRDRGVDGKSPYTESETAAALQEGRGKLNAAAETLLFLLQPVHMDSEDGPHWFPLPREWIFPSELTPPYFDLMTTESSRYMAESLMCTRSQLKSITDRGEETMIFREPSEVSHSTLLRCDGPRGNFNTKSVHEEVRDDVSEEDYVKAFFNLDPLPIHEADDVIVYTSLLHKNGILAGASGVYLPHKLPGGAAMEEEEEEEYDGNEKEEATDVGGATGKMRGGAQSTRIQSRQQEREAAGRYGLWCTMEPLMKELSGAGTATRQGSRLSANVRGSGKGRRDVQLPRWCIQVCGGALPGRRDVLSPFLESSAGSTTIDGVDAPTVVPAHFEALFFPQPPDDPLNMFGPQITESTAISASCPICSIPLTPQLLRATEVTQYRQVIMRQEKRVLLRHEQEDGFVFGRGDDRDELFLLLTNVTVDITLRYALNLSVYLMPCRRIFNDSSDAKASSSVVLVEVPLFHNHDAMAATRCVHGAKLTFTTKSAFVKAYRALLWASKVNIIDMHPTPGIPSYLSANNGESLYVTIRCFASFSRKAEKFVCNSYREECVRRVASVFGRERGVFGQSPYRLEDFVLEKTSSRGKRKPLSSAATPSLTPATIDFAVAFDEYGVVYRAIHTPSAQLFDVRVLPRNRTKLLWADAAAAGEDWGSEGDLVSRSMMEATLVAEYLSRMPYQNPIAAVLCDAHNCYIVCVPIFSVLSEIKHNAAVPSPLTPQHHQRFGVLSLRSFIDKVLRSPHALFATRWSLARLVAAQLLLVLISLHGKGVVLGPRTPEGLFVRWNPSAVSGISLGDNDGKGVGLTTRDFHLVVPTLGVSSDAWVYERQQPGVLEYIPPRYLFRVAHGTVIRDSGASEWTIGDDYWLYLCLLFELFSVTGESLVAVASVPSMMGDREQRPFTSTLPGGKKDIWQLWKRVFKATHHSLSEGAAHHRQTAVAQALQHFVHSRVEASILPNVEAWVMMEERRRRSKGPSPSEATGTGRDATRSTLRAVSLADAYAVALRLHTSSHLISKEGGGGADGLATVDPAAATAHVAQDIQSSQAFMLTIQHFFKILVDTSLQSTAACVDKTARHQAWAILSHPFFIGIDFAMLFDGKSTVPHAEFLCNKLGSKSLLSGATNTVSMKSHTNTRGFSPQSQTELQQLLSPLGASVAPRFSVSPFSLAMEEEEEGDGSAWNNDDAFAPSSSRSPRSSMHYGTYKADEIKEMKKVQEEVQRALNNFSSADTVPTSLFLAEERKQSKRYGYSHDLLTMDSVAGAQRKSPGGNKGEKSSCISNWRRLHERAKTAANNSDIHRDKNTSDLLLPTASDPTESRVGHASLKLSKSSILRSLSSADPLRCIDRVERQGLQHERLFHVVNEYDASDDQRLGLRGSEEFLRVARSQRNSLQGVRRPQSRFPSGETHFFTRGDDVAVSTEGTHRGELGDSAGAAAMVARSGSKEENWRNMQNLCGVGESPKFSGTRDTKRPACVGGLLCEKKMTTAMGGDFLFRVHGRSLTTVFPLTAVSEPARNKTGMVNEFTLVPSGDEDDDDDEYNDKDHSRKREEKDEGRRMTVASASWVRNSHSVLTTFDTLCQRESGGVSYSSSTFRSSTRVASVHSHETSEIQKHERHQQLQRPDDAVWELVRENDEEESDNEPYVFSWPI
ncbi:hypothetical protein MOQ_004817 [Trypanosoma cruzi marinkellei]|uniref:Protein kinase domain-containing protein n=1 Tax=Trypanosoma cruzi marinkellei TaxID=85056 RepID=K2NQZ9_TRYCR|nr:hypothetical protein MOQ_004817 [Trypanosoma cruzi marinkellei]